MTLEGVNLKSALRKLPWIVVLGIIVWNTKITTKPRDADQSDAMAACTDVCVNEVMYVVRAAFDSNALRYDKANQVTKVAIDRCHDKCKDRLGI